MEIEHITTYEYTGDIDSQYNEVRVTPRDTSKQFMIEHTLEISPHSSVEKYKDYFGTRVTTFALEKPHNSLSITAKSLVETAAGASRVSNSPVTWNHVKSSVVSDTYCEYLSKTEFVDDLDFDQNLIDQFSSMETPGKAVEAVMAWLRESIAYVPGATSVNTKASQALKARTGVCQDFVHLALSMLREIGIPCRYVSGYLYPFDHGEVGEIVAGESHAWCEVWLGDWYGVDPTNDTPVSERHVLVGWGRDYSDVAPVKGVLHGDPRSEMTVQVYLKRVA